MFLLCMIISINRQVHEHLHLMYGLVNELKVQKLFDGVRHFEWSVFIVSVSGKITIKFFAKYKRKSQNAIKIVPLIVLIVAKTHTNF